MAGLVFTPELYKVGINYVGLSDIARWGLLQGFRNRNKVSQQSIARRWLNPDTEKKEIGAVSPINFIKNIQVPSLHAYGRYDPRVTIDQGEVLKDELKKHGKNFKFIEVENEGHGFNKFENKIAFYGEMDAFLKQYMPVENAAGVKVGPTKVIQMPAKTN